MKSNGGNPLSGERITNVNEETKPHAPQQHFDLGKNLPYMDGQNRIDKETAIMMVDHLH